MPFSTPVLCTGVRSTGAIIALAEYISIRVADFVVLRLVMMNGQGGLVLAAPPSSRWHHINSPISFKSGRCFVTAEATVEMKSSILGQGPCLFGVRFTPPAASTCCCLPLRVRLVVRSISGTSQLRRPGSQQMDKDDNDLRYLLTPTGVLRGLASTWFRRADSWTLPR